MKKDDEPSELNFNLWPLKISAKGKDAIEALAPHLGLFLITAGLMWVGIYLSPLFR
jgi:hypothetical protein